MTPSKRVTPNEKKFAAEFTENNGQTTLEGGEGESGVSDAYSYKLKNSIETAAAPEQRVLLLTWKFKNGKFVNVCFQLKTLLK